MGLKARFRRWVCRRTWHPRAQVIAMDELHTWYVWCGTCDRLVKFDNFFHEGTLWTDDDRRMMENRDG